MMHRQPEAEGGNPVHRWLDLVGCSYESQSGWMMFAAKNRGSFLCLCIQQHVLQALCYARKPFLILPLEKPPLPDTHASYINLFYSAV